MEQTSIRISADVQANANVCKFTVDQPVFPGGFARFTDPQKAQGSPLARRLFAIEGIAGVDVGENILIITKQRTDDWRTVGPLIGAAIRAHLASGDPVLTPEALQQLPDEDKLRAKVQRILDEQINPAVASHGGTISLIDVQGKKLFLKMGGGCQGCGSATATLRQGVEEAIRSQVPEVEEILDVTDHAAGANPYL